MTPKKKLVKANVNSADLLKNLKKVAKAQLLVGVSSKTSKRPGGEISNAQLAFIHEHGSVSAGIPPRPFLHPGVKAAKPKITVFFRQAVDAVRAGHVADAELALEKAGLVAQSSVKNAIRNGDFAPLRPATITYRNRSRATIGKRENEKRGSLNFGANVKPLINTGELLKSITYVVEGGKWH